VIGRGAGGGFAAAAIAAWAAACALAAPRAAHASDFVLSARTVGQGYQERRYGPSGAVELLGRRRLTQYLDLSVFNISPESWRGPAGDRNLVSFEMGMRFDSDFGPFLLGRPRGPDAIAELEQDQIDVLYAYLLARDVGGHLDLQLGRQVHFDLVDFYAFDGGDARANIGRWVTVEAFGGTAVRGELPLSSPLYQLDGTSAGSRDPATHPEQDRALHPMLGAALAVDRASPVTARVAYRREFSATVDPLPGYPRTGVNHQSLSATAEGHVRERAFFTAAARYNLLFGVWDDQQLTARLRIGARHALAAEYSYLAPTFDGDSIWNVFASQAFDDVRAAYDVSFWKIRAYAQAFARLFYDDNGTYVSAGGTAGGRLALGTRGWLRLDGYYEDGYGGRRAGVDLATRIRLYGDNLGIRKGSVFAEGRLSYASFQDDSRPVDHAESFGVQAGVRWTPLDGISVHGLLEENVNRIYLSQLRVVALLDLSFWVGMKPRGIRRPQPWSGL